MRRQTYWFFSYSFLAVGLAITSVGLMQFRAARVSPGWPSIEGIVVDAVNLEEYTIDGGYHYKPVVAFKYEVEGREYFSDRLTYGRKKFPDEAFVDHVIRQYPAGMSVTVYYNPRRPRQAVLQPGDTSGTGVIAGTGIVIAVLSLFPIVRGRRRDPMRL